jgi:hypothetical protein
MDPQAQQQQGIDTCLPHEKWQPQKDELVWLNILRRDGKVSTFRVRVLQVKSGDEPAVEVEVFPEFELARPFTYTTDVSDITPLD